jgi:hypothetical protein
MTQASSTPGAARPTHDGASATAQDPSALTDAELDLVVWATARFYADSPRWWGAVRSSGHGGLPKTLPSGHGSPPP